MTTRAVVGILRAQTAMVLGDHQRLREFAGDLEVP
jgi:hypothetical protein